MNKLRLSGPVIALVSLLAVNLPALEVADGNLALIIHEDTGRFSLYEKDSEPRSRPRPLYVDQDPRTSFSTILINNRAYRLGETTVFKLSSEKTANGALMRWDSPVLKVEQAFSFVKSKNNPDISFLRMDVRLYNSDSADMDVGYRLTLDTNLSERSRMHFKSDAGREVENETIILPARDADRFLASVNERTGFMIAIQGGGLIPPDSIHIANWKRLSDAPWKATHQEGRNFNSLPYSIGDSALSLYYNHRTLARGGERVYTLLMGSYQNEGFPSLEDGSFASPLPIPSVPLETDQQLLRDLQELQSLIDRLEQAKIDGIIPSERELARMEELLNRLSLQVEK